MKNGKLRIFAAVLLGVMLMLPIISAPAFAFSFRDQKYTFVDDAVEQAVRDTLGIYNGPVYRSDLDRVAVLRFEYTTIGDVSDILNCRHVSELYFDHTQINDFSRLSTMYGLESITLTDCPVDMTAFQNGFFDLKHLHIEDCEIDDLTGIEQLYWLESLTLKDCGISDISALEGLRGLRYLCLSGNNIANIDSVYWMSGLEELDISYNPVTDFSVTRYLRYLVNLDTTGTGSYASGGFETPRPQSGGPVWGVAAKKISTRTGPSTKYEDGGTYDVKGQSLKVLSRAWDPYNEIWWVEVEIPYNGEIRVLWTGYHRFDSSTIPLESIPIAD